METISSDLDIWAAARRQEPGRESPLLVDPGSRFHILVLVSPPQNVKNAAYSSQLLHTFGFRPDNILLSKVSDTNH